MPFRVMPTIVAALLLLCLTAGLSMANDYRTIENAGPQEVVDAMATKFARGLANTTTGWLEFPKQIYTTSRDDGIAKGIFIGPMKGLGMTLVRTVSGVLETATFLIPYPGFYEPYFDPSYVWRKE